LVFHSSTNFKGFVGHSFFWKAEVE